MKLSAETVLMIGVASLLIIFAWKIIFGLWLLAATIGIFFVTGWLIYQSIKLAIENITRIYKRYNECTCY